MQVVQLTAEAIWTRGVILETLASEVDWVQYPEGPNRESRLVELRNQADVKMRELLLRADVQIEETVEYPDDSDRLEIAIGVWDREFNLLALPAEFKHSLYPEEISTNAPSQEVEGNEH